MEFIIIVFSVFIFRVIETRMLLHSTRGDVERENFTYYSLNYKGHVTLILNTIEGDADVYISEKHLLPSYEPEQYDLHSATCGYDVVDIPKSFKRPIGVGVYGYSAHEKSSYVLEVYLNKQTEDFTDYFDSESSSKLTENGNAEEEKLHKKDKVKLKNVITKTGLWAFVELFEMLFL